MATKQQIIDDLQVRIKDLEEKLASANQELAKFGSGTFLPHAVAVETKKKSKS
jgi:hypothetical protein